jgi:hypothetical protein
MSFSSVFVLLAALAAAPGLVVLGKPAEQGGVAAFPMILSPETAATRRINAALGRLDQAERSAAKNCIAGAHGHGEWSREIDTPMRGPDFVSYVVTDEVDCGGAHPHSGHSAIVYDLADGRPVDWTHLLPPAVFGKLGLQTGADGVPVVTLRSARLTDLHHRGYDRDGNDPAEAKACIQAVADLAAEGPIPMMAWLDAGGGGVALQFDLGHADQACSDPVVVPVSVLRREGAAPRLIAALEAAHASAAKPTRRPR